MAAVTDEPQIVGLEPQRRGGVLSIARWFIDKGNQVQAYMPRGHTAQHIRDAPEQQSIEYLIEGPMMPPMIPGHRIEKVTISLTQIDDTSRGGKVRLEGNWLHLPIGDSWTIREFTLDEYFDWDQSGRLISHQRDQDTIEIRKKQRRLLEKFIDSGIYGEETDQAFRSELADINAELARIACPPQPEEPT